MDAALYSGNVSVVDYFRNYFDMYMIGPSSPHHASYEYAAYLSPWNKIRPVEFLSIVQRIADHTDIEGAIKQGNTDVLIYLLQTTRLSANKIHQAIYSSLQDALGNIPMLIYLCTYLSQNKVSKKNIHLLDNLLQIWEKEENSLLYPQSIGLLETYLRPDLEFAFARREYKKLEAEYLGSPSEEA
nr:hypothetical protein Cplu_79 [Cedratvirus plubellavi]